MGNMNILQLFKNNKEMTVAKGVDIELYNQMNKLRDRFSITTSAKGDPIDFSISKDWERFKHSISGLILMREYYSNENVKCVHNKWEKDAKLPLHIHKDADQTLWVHNGSLCIDIYDDEGEKIITTKILNHTNIDQPYFIKKGVPHVLTSLVDTDFVARFDIYKN